MTLPEVVIEQQGNSLALAALKSGSRIGEFCVQMDHSPARGVIDNIKSGNHKRKCVGCPASGLREGVDLGAAPIRGQERVAIHADRYGLSPGHLKILLGQNISIL